MVSFRGIKLIRKSYARLGGGGPHGVMVKVRFRTPVGLLCSLSDKYHWERYEPLFLPRYGLNSISAVLVQGWLWH